MAVLVIGTVSGALAGEIKQGEEVAIDLKLNNTNAAYVRVMADFDSSVFEVVKYESSVGTAGSNGIVVYDTKPLASGVVGTVTLRVKADAAPGSYTVSGKLVECYDVNENYGTASVSGGTVYVAGNTTPAPTQTPQATPTPAPTEKPEETKEAQYTLTDPSYVGNEVTGKIIHVDGTPFAEKLRVRVTFYIEGGYYMAATCEVDKEGSYAIIGVGPIIYITVAALDNGPNHLKLSCYPKEIIPRK